LGRDRGAGGRGHGACRERPTRQWQACRQPLPPRHTAPHANPPGPSRLPTCSRSQMLRDL